MDLDKKEWWNNYLSDENAVIIDVRTEDEFNSSKIPGALNLDIYKGQGFIYSLDKLDKNKNYYVYCAAGGRSAQACGVMNQMGFSKVYNLLGGIYEWDGPVE
ncbi:MAG TPA: rhodanese-like domain-containing protein [Flavobacterium sp.]|nr:rhodanese-like domain-containing protein [Flavobacterium sp.]